VSVTSRRPPTALRVGVSNEGARVAVSAGRLADAVRHVLRAEKVGDAMLSVTLLSASAMARLNRRHLGHAGATDVISFGFAPTPGGAVVGDIYVCPAVARDNAHAAGCGVREELLRLVVHGTLHVLGWDHPVDGARTTSPMWKRQERLLAAVMRRGAPKA
jgi:probable rRNA maturation factor